MDFDSSTKASRFELYCGVTEIQRHWQWFLAIGMALVLLGILAIGASALVTIASMFFFGVMLLIGGIVQIANAFKTRHGSSFMLNLLAALFSTIVGGLIILHPEIGAVALTLLLAAYFAVTGLFKIIAAIIHRYAQWGWLLLNGIITLLLGMMIWAEWPISGLWVIGLFIGVDLIIAGSTWIALSLSVKSIPSSNSSFD